MLIYSEMHVAKLAKVSFCEGLLTIRVEMQSKIAP